ncbi:hypothetical protein PMIN04_012084 [Paraphaeosphaeria minitans]
MTERSADARRPGILLQLQMELERLVSIMSFEDEALPLMLHHLDQEALVLREVMDREPWEDRTNQLDERRSDYNDYGVVHLLV